MKFYHGTTKDAWEKIKKEGVLWGVRTGGSNVSRCTYLTPDKEEAKQYGEVLLEIEYEPSKGINNYQEGCWQFREYEPIPIKFIKKIQGGKEMKRIKAIAEKRTEGSWSGYYGYLVDMPETIHDYDSDLEELKKKLYRQIDNHRASCEEHNLPIPKIIRPYNLLIVWDKII